MVWELGGDPLVDDLTLTTGSGKFVLGLGMGAKTRPPHTASGLALRGVQGPFGLTSCAWRHFGTRDSGGQPIRLRHKREHGSRL
jgi:hypothetical protein